MILYVVTGENHLLDTLASAKNYEEKTFENFQNKRLLLARFRTRTTIFDGKFVLKRDPNVVQDANDLYIYMYMAYELFVLPAGTCRSYETSECA